MRKTSTALLSPLLASSPLRHASFRMFYFGSIGVALGYTMQATIAAWLMATLTPSALMVALVQTASMAPTLAFGLVAGAMGDRKLQEHVERFQRPGVAIRVSRLIGVKPFDSELDARDQASEPPSS